RWCPVDGETECLDDRAPRISIGRMQPGAAKIDRTCTRMGQRMGPAARPGARLHHQDRGAGVAEKGCRREPRRTRADDDDVHPTHAILRRLVYRFGRRNARPTWGLASGENKRERPDRPGALWIQSDEVERSAADAHATNMNVAVLIFEALAADVAALIL